MKRAVRGTLFLLVGVLAAGAVVAAEPAQLGSTGTGDQLVAGESVSAPLPAADPHREPAGRVSVLVYLDPKLPPGSAEKKAVRLFAREQGAIVQYEYRLLPHLLNLRRLPADAIDRLRAQPGVQRVEMDQYHENVVRLDEATPLVRGLQSQVSGAGLNADGTGVRVCIVDTGIDTDHTMYASRIDSAAGWDFYNNDSNPEDDNGHGSHVAGIAVGGTGLTVDLGCEGVEDFQGLAPNATLIGAKVLNSAGGGFDSDIVAGIDHCADQTASGGRADVINLSIGTGFWSGTCDSHPWASAANAAVNNGVVVVAASGNENNSNGMGSPACGSQVIAVGATYKDNYPNCEDGTSNFNWGSCSDSSPRRDDVVCFSNESDLLDVTAPGSVILSASNAAGGNSLTSKSGTSMASPAVAGLAALVLDMDQTLTPADVRQLLRDGAVDMGPAGFDRAYGYGRIDVINTLNLIAPCSTNADCDDGLFCNGSETCAGGACQPGADPCPGQGCDEASDSCVAAPAVIYEWTMDTDPAWTMQGQWQWGQPSGGGGQHGNADPTSGATGANVVGYNLSGDYANNLGETNLTTTAFDCSNLIDVKLRFQRWLGVEQPTYDHAYVRVSNDGNQWTTVWSNGAEVADGAWSLQEYDISAVADGQPTVFVRWTMGTTDSSWQYCGWNIDDVQIVASDTGGGGPTCSDGLQNQGETRIDCGGPCPACQCTSDAACDDGLFCSGTETCDGFGNCQAGADPCPGQMCDEAGGVCVDCLVDTDCDDGQFCNGPEVCSAGTCQPGTAVDCNDGVSCTSDACNETTDSCDHTPSNAVCDDGLFCNGAETCDVNLDCQAGADPCPGQSCDEASDICAQCTVDADCNDGLYCNGSESCVAGSCQAGTPVTCDDGVGCTADACDEAGDICTFTPSDAACDDGLFCNGSETCDASLDCQAGGDPCPGQMCDEAGNVCADCLVDADCADGVFCNGAEVCAGGTCQAGGDPCPGLFCDETAGACAECLVDADCDDGLFCNGAESCAGGACQTGADPCPGQTCDEATDTCQSGPAARLESGTVTVGGTAVTVALQNSYVSPVVVASVQYLNNTAPVVTRISAVSGTSFDIYLQNPSGGSVSAETVSYLVVEEGNWTIDGVQVEAQSYLSTITAEDKGWSAETQSYLQSYTNPVVVGQVMSTNDSAWSVFWDRGKKRNSPPTASQLRTGKTVCEDPAQTRADETVGFIVFESGHGTIGGVEFEAGVSGDSVKGVGDNPPYAISFQTGFGSVPQVAVTTMAAVDGGNGGWAQTHGATPTTASQLFLSVDEDQLKDSERRHTTEQVGYVVFASPVLYP